MKFPDFAKRALFTGLFGLSAGGIAGLSAVFYTAKKVEIQTKLQWNYDGSDAGFVLACATYTALIGAFIGTIWNFVKSRGPVSVGFVLAALAGLVGMIPQIVAAGSKTVDWDVPLAYSLIFGVFGGAMGFLYSALRNETNRRKSEHHD